MTVTIAGYAAFLLLFPLLTRHVTQRRNWARVATWGLAGLNAVAMLAALGRPQLGLAQLLDGVAMLLDAAIVALLVAPTSSTWFRTG